MNLTNESYLIKISGGNFTELYYKEQGRWYKVSSRGRKLEATAEQVLNHLLPAMAGVKLGLTVVVEHYEDPGERALPNGL